MASSSMVDEKIKIAAIRGAQILVENGLSDWKIKLNNKRSSLAETWHSEKTIAFSKHFIIIADEEQFEGVTLHEVTHALLGVGYGHGKEFVELCTKISPNDNYARRTANVKIAKYLMTCTRCGQSGGSSRARDLYCGMCFDENAPSRMMVERNKLIVRMWASKP